MKVTTSALALHLLQPLTTLADCCRIQWRSGRVLAFTSHDEPLVIEGDTYAPTPGMQRFAVQSQGTMAVDNTEILGVIDDDVIQAADIEDGLWDFADVRFFQVNWQDLSMGQLKLRAGWVGEIKTARGTYTAEVRGLPQALVREIGDLYAPDCQADLGDARCTVNVPALTVTGTVTDATGTDGRIFEDTGRTEAEHWFDQGVLTWTTGTNAGRSMEVEYFSGTAGTPQGGFALFLPMRHPVQIGDQYQVYPGCAKTIDNCINKFNNIANYRGFPYAVSGDELLLYPDSHV